MPPNKADVPLHATLDRGINRTKRNGKSSKRSAGSRLGRRELFCGSNGPPSSVFKSGEEEGSAGPGELSMEASVEKAVQGLLDAVKDSILASASTQNDMDIDGSHSDDLEG